MVELLIAMTAYERVLTIILAFVAVVYLITIIKRKNLSHGKDGFSLTDSTLPKTREHIIPSIEPTWSKEIPGTGGIKIGFYSFGNFTKVFGSRWNSTMDAVGYRNLRQSIVPHTELGEYAESYNFWIIDLIGANVQSTLISILIDKSKVFDAVYIFTDSKNHTDLRALSPENSQIKNVYLIHSE